MSGGHEPCVFFIIISLTCLLVTCAQNPAGCQVNQWQAGIAKAVITPQTPVWLAGYGTARPPDGKIHDLWVKVLSLKDPAGKRVVMATTDHMGMSKTIYESLCRRVRERFGLERAEFMITFSHNHCGPVLKDDLVDYYPLNDEQRRLVDEYTEWMETRVIAAVGEARAICARRSYSRARGSARSQSTAGRTPRRRCPSSWRRASR